MGSTGTQVNAEELLQFERLFCQSELARGLFHEINNSLARILGCAQLLIAFAQERKEESEDLKAMEGEIFRLRKMIQSFVHLSQAYQGVEGPLEMNSLLNLLLSSLQDQQDFSNIYLIKEFCSEDLFCPGDGQQWWTILIGLLLKASRTIQKEGVLHVSTSRKPGGTFEVVIKGSGTKVPKDMTAHPFIPFYSSRGKRKDLAVYLAQRAARESGGSLRVNYYPRGNCTISISLPQLGKK